MLDNLSLSLQWGDITDHSLGIGYQIGCPQEKAAWEPVVKGIPPVAHGWLRKRHHENYLGLLAAFSGPAGLLPTGDFILCPSSLCCKPLFWWMHVMQKQVAH